MTLPVSAPTASDSYNNLRRATANIMAVAQQLQPALAANAADPVMVLQLLTNAVFALSLLAGIQASPPLMVAVVALYASETGDTTDTTGAAVVASATALQALVAAIVADFPKAADGKHLAWQSLGLTGAMTCDVFMAAHFPTAIPALTAWLATVA